MDMKILRFIKVFCLLLPLLFSIEFSFASSFSSTQDNRALLTQRIFNELRHDNTHILDSFYHRGVKFEDPIGTIDGIDEMKSYYQKMYKDVESISFNFKNYSQADNRYFFSWDMTLKTPKLNSGEEFIVSGVSEILFEGNLVAYHRDYFDMGAFIYEKVPVLGRIVRILKSRLEYKP